MRTRFVLLIVIAALVIPNAMLVGCASHKTATAPKEQNVTIAEVSTAARATIAKATADGHVDKITKEVERGKTVYDVEATIQGKHMEYLIADSDGELLGTEVPITFAELPQPVQAAAEKYFGTTSSLTVMKGVEYGETQYEIEGKKGGKIVEVTFDPAGKQPK